MKLWRKVVLAWCFGAFGVKSQAARRNGWLGRAASARSVGTNIIYKLSAHMQRTLDAIRAHGGTASPEGGGWWRGADGARLDVQTKTIYALARRQLLRRTGQAREAWRDTYVVSQPTNSESSPSGPR
jgi:hypothetical protein